MCPTISSVIQSISKRTPLETADTWDNVGLLVGDPKQECTGVVLSIDLTFEAVELAVQKKHNLIINHHPCLFPKGKGPSRIIAGTPVFEAIRNGISVAAFHTNFDQCALEVVHSISSGLKLEPRGRLIENRSFSLMKMVVFVPESHISAVQTALFEAGAGHVGLYDQCSFTSEGEGTFRGGEGTNPFVGQPGKREKVGEIRMETILPRGLKNQVLSALLESHPYEEVAYDLYPVEQPAGQTGLISGLGYGFWGEFPSPRLFSDVSKDVKSLFNINGFWITNPAPVHVSRVGFAAGKGAAFVEAALASNCDLFITGEAGYHTALGSSNRGMAVIELGHRESEKFFIETMKSWLSQIDLSVIETQMPTQKFWSGGNQ